MSKRAQFTAEVKKVNTDGKKKVIQLEVTGKIAPEAFLNVVDMIGDRVVVTLGDPQMSLDFEEDHQEERKGVSYLTDASGVVTNVEHPNSEPEEQEENGEPGDEDLAIFDEPDSDETETTVGEPTSEEDDSLPVFGEPSEQSEDTQAFDESELSQAQEPSAGNDKEALEAFILSGQAPVFEDIIFDFPALLARRQSGETWIKIAASINTSSTKLQAAWAKYKKLVTEHMAKINGNEEAGAA